MNFKTFPFAPGLPANLIFPNSRFSRGFGFRLHRADGANSRWRAFFSVALAPLATFPSARELIATAEELISRSIAFDTSSI
jgi:hypothetical protein